MKTPQSFDLKTGPIPTSFFPFLWYFLKDHKIAVTIYVGLALAAGFWGPFNSMLIKQLIDALPQGVSGNISVLLWPAGLITLNFIIFDNLVWRLLNLTTYRVLPVILSKVDSTILNHVLKHSHQFFQERMAGALSRQIFNLIDGFEKTIATYASNIIRSVTLLLTAFIFAALVNKVFFCILLIWSIFFFGISLSLAQRIKKLAENQALTESTLGGQIVDSLTNAFTISLFAQRNLEITRRCPTLLKYQGEFKRKGRYLLVVSTIQGALIATMLGLSSFFLVHFYGKGQVTMGDFALILGLSIEAGHMMWWTVELINDLFQIMGKCRQSLGSLLQTPEIQDAPNTPPLVCPTGQIIFDNVSFQYKETIPLFENKTIEIPGGQKVGLVGHSGGGKSTFVNLILRLYNVTGGKIIIDGQDIQSVQLDSLHEHIGMIPQDPSLFHRSIMENIRYGHV